MQTVAIDLMPGEAVYSQTNSMSWNDAIGMYRIPARGFLVVRTKMTPDESG